MTIKQHQLLDDDNSQAGKSILSI